MTETEESKDDLIRELVKGGARTLPNAHFDNQVMLEIQREINHKNEVATHLRASMHFFLGALVSGVGLLLIILFNHVLDQNDLKILIILMLFGACVIGILNVDNYRRLINNHSL